MAIYAAVRGPTPKDSGSARSLDAWKYEARARTARAKHRICSTHGRGRSSRDPQSRVHQDMRPKEWLILQQFGDAGGVPNRSSILTMIRLCALVDWLFSAVQRFPEGQ